MRRAVMTPENSSELCASEQKLGDDTASGTALTSPAAPSHRQLIRFLMVGGTTVGIDFLSYSILLVFGASIDVSKIVGFLVGTVFAYFANRLWTFQEHRVVGNRIMSFVGLYGTTLLVNVLANRATIWIFSILGINQHLSLGIAFLIATGLSATLNFVGMKYIVFRAHEDPLS